MENQEQHLEALKDIRQLMKQSNRFLSLSGLSGIFAGLYALIGAYAGHSVIINFIIESRLNGYTQQRYQTMIIMCVLICVLVLGMSVLTAYVFTARKAKRSGDKLFDHTAWQLLINMFIPLAAGGLFCLAMLYHGGAFVVLVGPAMLIFYGLALINCSKYTLHDIRYLGIMQLLLGIISCFFINYWLLLFWAFGFGVLHIIYGTIMWYKYDRKK